MSHRSIFPSFYSDVSILSPKQKTRHSWGLCRSGSAGPEGRGEESPEALQAVGHQVGRLQLPELARQAAHTWPSPCGAVGRPGPSPAGTVQVNHQPQRSPLPLTTPCVCSSGNPKFVCQIQDTTLTVPGFSFCLSLIASGRALLKGKWCVLTGQALRQKPGNVSHKSHCPACHRLSLLILTARLPPRDV